MQTPQADSHVAATPMGPLLSCNSFLSSPKPSMITTFFFFIQKVETFDGHKCPVQCQLTLSSSIYNTLKLIQPSRSFSYAWQLVPFHLPRMSGPNPLFKDHVRGRPWGAVGTVRFIWKWSFVWHSAGHELDTSCHNGFSTFFSFPTEF